MLNVGRIGTIDIVATTVHMLANSVSNCGLRMISAMFPMFKTKVCNLLHVSVLPCYDFNASVLVFQERSECDMAKWRPLDDYSPIARLLVEYMWEQRPPLLPNQFAQR